MTKIKTLTQCLIYDFQFFEISFVCINKIKFDAGKSFASLCIIKSSKAFSFSEIMLNCYYLFILNIFYWICYYYFFLIWWYFFIHRNRYFHYGKVTLKVLFTNLAKLLIVSIIIVGVLSSFIQHKTYMVRKLLKCRYWKFWTF